MWEGEQSKLSSSIVDGARMARIRFMTVNKGAGVNRDDAWKVEEIEAQRDAMGRRGLDDAASSDVELRAVTHSLPLHGCPHASSCG